jgi:hypothetical protein
LPNLASFLKALWASRLWFASPVPGGTKFRKVLCRGRKKNPPAQQVGIRPIADWSKLPRCNSIAGMTSSTKIPRDEKLKSVHPVRAGFRERLNRTLRFLLPVCLTYSTPRLRNECDDLLSTKGFFILCLDQEISHRLFPFDSTMVVGAKSR